MLVLAISRRGDGFDPQRLGALQKAEAQTVWNLYQEGIIKQFYFDAARKPDPKGILIIEAEGRDQARDIAISRLPLVKEGLIDFELYELGPYAALAMAFDHG